MEEITKVIAVGRPIDLPGVRESMPPGEYRLVYRVEADPIDERQIYYHDGEAIETEGDRRFVLCGHQVEALLQSPYVIIADPSGRLVAM